MMENKTKYSNFFTGIGREDLRGQEGFLVTDRLHKFIERRMDAYLNGELEPEREPEVDDEGYILGHWADSWKVPKSQEPIDVPF